MTFPPPDEVVTAFAGELPVERLSGGRGVTWRAGSVVLRPAEGLGETEWASDVLSRLEPAAGFAVPEPLRDDRGAWTRDGWHAQRLVPGSAGPSRVEEVLRGGAAFHRALAEIPKPAFFALRDHPWARADRIAWGEEQGPRDAFLDLLLDAYAPVDLPAQLIHGDLLGNVLFADDHPPAVIDWAPYWRPAAYAGAIAVADAVSWHGHPLDRSADGGAVPEWRQLLLRALVFRMTTLHLLGTWSDDLGRRHAPVVQAVLALDAGRRHRA